MTVVLEVKGIYKSYRGRRVLSGVSFSVRRGEVYTLLGPNGSGKTTLLNIVVGVLKPDRGSVAVNGLDPSNPRARRFLSYCPQEDGLIDWLTGWENIAFYSRLRGVPLRAAFEEAGRLAEEIGLERTWLAKRVAHYSGGMRRILSIIIGLLGEPGLLVLDEPTTGLDPHARRRVWDLIVRTVGKGVTVLMATHDMVEADKLSRRVAIIYRGRIVSEGQPNELKKVYAPPSAIVVEADDIDLAVRSLEGYRVYVADGMVRVLVEDPERELPRIVERVYRVTRIRGVKLVEPTLEDVFFRLTGRRLSGL